MAVRGRRSRRRRVWRQDDGHRISSDRVFRFRVSVRVGLCLHVCPRRFIGVLYHHGYRRTRELQHEFNTLDARRPTGLAPLLGAAEKPDKSYMYDRLSGSALIDPVLEEVCVCACAQRTRCHRSSNTHCTIL